MTKEISSLKLNSEQSKKLNQPAKNENILTITQSQVITFSDSNSINLNNKDSIIDINGSSTTSIKKQKNRHLPDNEKDIIIQQLDDKYIVLSNFDVNDIIDAINKGEGDDNKIANILFL